MFDRIDTLICNIHGLEFQYPSNFRELELPRPQCSVCLSEQLLKTNAEIEKTKSDLKVVLDAITIKINRKVKI